MDNRNNQTVTVVGLGYVGLPAAALLANSGYYVQGVDINPIAVDAINSGNVHFSEKGLHDLVQSAVGSGRLNASTEIKPASIYIIAVPTPINPDKTADLSYVLSAVESICKVIEAGDLVINESTCPPRTCLDYIGPYIEKKTGLKHGVEYDLVYCPERLLPGNIVHEIVHNDRVVGGTSSDSARRAGELYRTFVKGRVMETDSVTAEMVKLMENTFRDVNIALANEFAIIAEKMGADVWQAIELANYHPRVKILRPGPGVGGHCIAVDPWFFVDRAPRESKLIRAAREINDDGPKRVVETIENLLEGKRGAKVACLGVAYKGGTDDMRESPAVHVLELLQHRGYDVSLYDPHIPAPAEFESISRRSLGEASRGAECLLVLTDHPEFRSIKPADFGEHLPPLIYDTRGILTPEPFRAAGVRVELLGIRGAEEFERQKEAMLTVG